LRTRTRRYTSPYILIDPFSPPGWVWERTIGAQTGFARARNLLDNTAGSPAEAVNRVDNLLE
jgi:hypothetical protein